MFLQTWWAYSKPDEDHPELEDILIQRGYRGIGKNRLKPKGSVCINLCFYKLGENKF